MKKYRPKERRKARELAMQAIYQWQLTEAAPVDIEVQFHQTNDMAKVDGTYFSQVFQGVIQHLQEIDEQILSAANRSLTELNPVELSVMRLAVYELLYEKSVPYKVVINEALEMTKKYGAVEGYKYVNGVLDKLARQIVGV